MAREITYNNFETSLVVFMPNITTNHAIIPILILTWPGKGLLMQIVMSSCPWDKPVSGMHARRGTPGGVGGNLG